MFKTMLQDWRRRAMFVALAAATVSILHVATVDAAPAALPDSCAHESCGIDGQCDSDLVNHYCCGSGSGCKTTSCLKNCE